MDSSGYLYVPRACTTGAGNHFKINNDDDNLKNNFQACKLHVVLHGCSQGKYLIGTIFADKTGYNQVADANNIIILYPQAKSSLLTNPNGCFDWWGYTNANYGIVSLS